MKLQEYQNMIYLKLPKVAFPATATNRRSDVAKGLVEDLIKRYKKTINL
jgi:hypothetical protein